MFISHTINNQVNRSRGRVLRLNYNDFESTLSELLCKDKFFIIYRQNIESLLDEILYKDLRHYLVYLKACTGLSLAGELICDTVRTISFFCSTCQLCYNELKYKKC